MDKGQIKRGFKPFRRKVSSTKGALRSIRECKICKSFYKGENGEEESCHNNSVTQYDMTVEETGKTYCNYWLPNWHTED